jgi:hypothetical protein
MKNDNVTNIKDKIDHDIMENDNVTNIKDKIDHDIMKNIEVVTIPTNTFLEFEPVPMQRDTQGRASTPKVKRMLKTLKPTHLEVAIVELLQSEKYYGRIYEKGWKGIVNGNTRAYYWKNCLSDKIPPHVFATVYKCKSMEEVREIYNQYDNPDSMEKTQQKVYGILSKLLSFEPTCEKIKKGEILTGLNYACYKLNPKFWNQANILAKDLPFQLETYIEEIKIFDKICNNRARWDQALICASLMSLKKYKNNSDELNILINGLKRIDERSYDTTGSEYDGITHICIEWFTSDKLFPTKGTSWSKAGGFCDTVPFALYWIQNYMQGKRLKQSGFNWRTVADKWYCDHNTQSINLNKLFSV